MIDIVLKNKNWNQKELQRYHTNQLQRDIPVKW